MRCVSPNDAHGVNSTSGPNSLVEVLRSINSLTHLWSEVLLSHELLTSWSVSCNGMSQARHVAKRKCVEVLTLDKVEHLCSSLMIVIKSERSINLLCVPSSFLRFVHCPYVTEHFVEIEDRAILGFVAKVLTKQLSKIDFSLRERTPIVLAARYLISGKLFKGTSNLVPLVLRQLACPFSYLRPLVQERRSCVI